MNRSKIYVIFPMAGEGVRFGYAFKPFLRATEKLFIELAKEPFKCLEDNGYTVEYIFTYKHSQENAYHVSTKLKELFPNDCIHTCLIDKSDGPLQTLQQTIEALNLYGKCAFVCDCDHMIDIEPMLPMITRKDVDVTIPVWNITPAEYPSFGKVRVDKCDKPVQFVEKEYIEPEDGDTIYGILGCYFFHDVSIALDYPSFPDVSTMLKDMLALNRPIQLVQIRHASFFGTPKQLENFRFSRAQTYTLFVDVDGVLVHHETKHLLPKVLETMQSWKNMGHFIILTSASSLEYVKELSNKFNLPNDYIISDLSPGPRIIINDIKPYLPFYQMADGICTQRDEGVEDINISKYIPPRILKHFNGASFAKTYLVTDNDNVFVRKHILKTEKTKDHVSTLRRQYEDLMRWEYISKGIVPKVLNYYESSSHLYFDMEYLANYETLSQFDNDTVHSTLKNLVSRISKDIYSFKRIIVDKGKWMNEFMQSKIYPKFENSLLPHLTKHNGIIINGKKYTDLARMFASIPYDKFAPDYEGMIHGDLTLENIMYNAHTDDVKVIDHAGSRYIDAIEMDIGKLFQSLLCSYHKWDILCTQLDIDDANELLRYTIPDELVVTKDDVLHKFTWLKYYNSNISVAYDRGVFFMTTYFIRMLPFFIAKSKSHATLLLLLCHVYLGQLCDC